MVRWRRARTSPLPVDGRSPACTLSSTWNSGVVLRSRSGPTCSTTRSNGAARCSIASRRSSAARAELVGLPRTPSHGEGVDEAADDVVLRGVEPTGLRQAHGDVVGSEGPVQQRPGGGQQHRRRGGPRAAGGGGDGRDVEPHRHLGAGHRRHRRAGPVGRDGQRRGRRVEAGGPPAHVVVRGVEAEAGDVGVLHRVGQLLTRVQRLEVADEDLLGPRVGGHVVHHQLQHRRPARRADEQAPQRRSGGEVERCAGAPPQLRVDLVVVAVEHRQQVVGHGDQLGVGLARVVGAHDLAQHVVPLDQPPQRGGQPGGVDGLVELQLQRDVVRGGPRVVAGEEPQPALRRVQRHPVADGAPGPPLGLRPRAGRPPWRAGRRAAARGRRRSDGPARSAPS